MRGGRRRRGMSLLEAMMAMVVLTVGVTAIFGMINHVQGANRKLSFHNTALDAFGVISAQIRDVRCDYLASAVVPGIDPLTTDPGLVAGEGGWFGAGGVAPGSSITYVGDATNNPAMVGVVPPIRIDYRTARRRVAPGQPFTSYTVDVRVREVTGDPVKDDILRVNGAWIRVYPVEKLCTARTDTVGRGEYQ